MARCCVDYFSVFFLNKVLGGSAPYLDISNIYFLKPSLICPKKFGVEIEGQKIFLVKRYLAKKILGKIILG